MSTTKTIKPATAVTVKNGVVSVEPVASTPADTQEAQGIIVGLEEPDETIQAVKSPFEESDEMELLLNILSYSRGHAGEGEKRFIDELLLPFFNDTPHDYVVKGPSASPSMANFVVTVPRKDGKTSSTLFSCHIDTTHGLQMDQTQNVAVDLNLEHVFLAKESRKPGACLGGDDGAGVWVMLNMIKRNVPGVYVFHRGEERGCIGSRWMADNEKDFLKSFKRAIAFDRKGTGDIITHQRGTRCCSDTFATALATQLNRHNVTYKPDPTGAYTDTASYTKLIPECTNLSVGYECNHGPDEYINYTHVAELLEACCEVDWDALPTERDPQAVDLSAYTMPGSSTSRSTSGGYGGYSTHSQMDLPLGSSTKRSKKKSNSKGTTLSQTSLGKTTSPFRGLQTHQGYTVDEMMDFNYGDFSSVIDDSQPAELIACFQRLTNEIAALRARTEHIDSFYADLL